MSEINSAVANFEIVNLHNYHRKYIDAFLAMQSHVDKLYNDWVIDINYKNAVLHRLDSMMRKLVRNYNRIFRSLKDENKITETDIVNFNSSAKIQEKMKNSLDLVLWIDDELTSFQYDDPFVSIRDELLVIGEDIGFKSINDFMKIQSTIGFSEILTEKQNEILDIYNDLFIPTSIKVTPYKKSPFIKITPVVLEVDSLIDNAVSMELCFKKLKLSVKLQGYISCDILNLKVRSSQICYQHLYDKKRKFCELLENEDTIDKEFRIKYLSTMNGNLYLIHSIDSLLQKVRDDYNKFTNMSSWNFNNLMKEFISADIKEMYRIINMLLMGNESHVHSAVMLFNTLKDKKVSGDNLADIIYHNLSFNAQLNIKKTSVNLKAELARVRALTPDSIPIEKKLAMNPNMPDNVKVYILDKMTEIKSGETNYKLQIAINGLMQFPWKPINAKNEYTDIRKSMDLSRNYLKNVAEKLDECVFGHEKSKKTLIELVGKWIQNPLSGGQVIGLVGPPGIGKTLLAKSISSALNIPLAIIGLGGMSDSSDLVGHSFTYAGAQYGMILRQMIKAGSWRSVMLFDEVDKVAKRTDTNEIYNTLIHITDPNMNKNFQDRFYSTAVDFDLSGVLVVFSYNNSDKIDSILLDRITEINISEYTLHEKVIICKDYMMKELCDSVGFPRDKIKLDDHVIKYIIEKYTTEAGVRDLRRKMEQILMKLNIDRYYMRGPFREIMCKKYLSKFRVEYENRRASMEDILDVKGMQQFLSFNKSKMEDELDQDTLNKIFTLEIEEGLTITTDLVHRYLDRPTSPVEELQNEDFVGVINGLYASNLGTGGIVPIQIYKNYVGDYNDGVNIKLKLTGHQKQVMRESVVCALTTAINLLDKKIISQITENFPHGFHIHASDGGTPKDGPSAGCAFATAFVSILLNKKINRYVAMTGEIELTGKISKIGGLSAKLQGAKKAGIKKVFICEDNREDYEQIKLKSPELFDHDFKVVIVRHIIEIVSSPEVILGVSPNDFDENVRGKIK